MKKSKSNVQTTAPSVQVAPPSVQDEAASVQVTTPSVQVEASSVQDEASSVQVTSPSVQDEATNVQVETNNVQVTKPKKVVNKVKTPVTKDPPPPPPPQEINRKAITVMFSVGEGSEYEHLSLIMKNRIAEGLTQNESHFVKQCIDYAINVEHFFEKGILSRFATHEETEPWEYKILKEALFSKIDTGLKTCK